MTKLGICLAVVLFGGAGCGFSQEHTRELSQHWDKARQEEATVAAFNHRLRGSVALADGSIPENVVEINIACSASTRLMAIADTKGKFSFSFQTIRQSDTELTADGCILSAYLPGYQSELKKMTEYANPGTSKVGTITLTPIAKDNAGLISKTTDDASRKAYDKAVDRAAHQDYDGALEALKSLLSEESGYSEAWLALGILEQADGKLNEARQSYLHAAETDSKYAAPFIRAALLEMAANNSHAALAHSQHAIDLNPKAFPDAYFINAQAHTALGEPALAEKSARAGLALDPTHRYPDLQYLLAMALYNQGDHQAATVRLEKYVADAPHAPSAPEAAKQLAELKAENAGGVDNARASKQQSEDPRAPIPTLPSINSVQDTNAALLENLSDYLCLASVASLLPSRYNGGSVISSLSRFEIGVSQGKEIYGEPGGKRLSEEDARRAQAAAAFHTRGLFSSLAGLLMQSHQLLIEPVGKLSVNGQSYDRYNFHSPPAFTGWNIAYGSQSGVAAIDGWFLTDSEHHLLRRVFVTATKIPANLKLLGLRAIVDYQSENIGGRRVLVPSKARVDADEQTGAHRTNLLSFNHWRSFNVEATISFSGPNDASGESGPETFTKLPPYAEIVVTLPDGAGTDKAVRAMVARALKYRGRTMVDAGAIVEGHLRRGWDRGTFVLELDRVQTPTGWTPFYALLMQIKDASGIRVKQPETSFMRPPGNVDPLAPLLDLNVPGVSTLLLPEDQTALPANMILTWRTAVMVP